MCGFGLLNAKIYGFLTFGCVYFCFCCGVVVFGDWFCVFSCRYCANIFAADSTILMHGCLCVVFWFVCSLSSWLQVSEPFWFWNCRASCCTTS